MIADASFPVVFNVKVEKPLVNEKSFAGDFFVFRFCIEKIKILLTNT